MRRINESQVNSHYSAIAVGGDSVTATCGSSQ